MEVKPALDGLMDELASMANDVGRHAGREAMTTLMRIIDPLPSDAHRALALGVALGYIRAKMDGLLDMGDGPLDKVLRRTFDISHKVFTAAGEEVLAMLRAGDLRGAAQALGHDPDDFELKGGG